MVPDKSAQKKAAHFRIGQHPDCMPELLVIAMSAPLQQPRLDVAQWQLYRRDSNSIAITPELGINRLFILFRREGAGAVDQRASGSQAADGRVQQSPLLARGLLYFFRFQWDQLSGSFASKRASDAHGASSSTRSNRSGTFAPTDRPSFR